MRRPFLSVLLCLALLPAAAARAEAGPWAPPTPLASDRVAAALVGADAERAAVALEALRRRPPEDRAARGRHHYLMGVALRASGDNTAALSFLRSAVAGPPGGPLHGPALLEAAITLQSLGEPAAADRLLLEAEPLAVRGADDDPATLTRLRAAQNP